MEKAGVVTDKTGRIVLAQWPNGPLWAAIGFYGLRWVGLAGVSEWGVTVAMLYWSYLELVSGVNGFRKVLGLLVGVATVYKLVGLIS